MLTAPATSSSLAINKIRDSVIERLEQYHDVDARIRRECHEAFLALPFEKALSEKHRSLHSSGPWIVYWCSHAFALMRTSLPSRLLERSRGILNSLENTKGGFGGADGQDPSVGLTYAGVIASMYLGFHFDRASTLKFLSSTELPFGSFEMVRNGEVDCRSVYCHVATSHMCGALDCETIGNAVKYLTACQSADGGFGGEPGAESHAGYTWCALAALALVDRLEEIDTLAALEWILARQSHVEGGCTGRPNKLVDTCYAFYVLASFIILMYALRERQLEIVGIDEEALANYILKCCQPCVDGTSGGGFCDQPGSSPDWYHTCYGLCALSMMKHDWNLERTSPILNIDMPHWRVHREILELEEGIMLGSGETPFHEWYTEVYHRTAARERD